MRYFSDEVVGRASGPKTSLLPVVRPSLNKKKQIFMIADWVDEDLSMHTSHSFPPHTLKMLERQTGDFL